MKICVDTNTEGKTEVIHIFLLRPWRIRRCIVTQKETVLKATHSISNLIYQDHPKYISMWNLSGCGSLEECQIGPNARLLQTYSCLPGQFLQEGASTLWVNVVVLEAAQKEHYQYQLIKNCLSQILWQDKMTDDEYK